MTTHEWSSTTLENATPSQDEFLYDPHSPGKQSEFTLTNPEIPSNAAPFSEYLQLIASPSRRVAQPARSRLVCSSQTALPRVQTPPNLVSGPMDSRGRRATLSSQGCLQGLVLEHRGTTAWTLFGCLSTTLGTLVGKKKGVEKCEGESAVSHKSIGKKLMEKRAQPVSSVAGDRSQSTEVRPFRPVIFSRNLKSGFLTLTQ